MKYNLKNSTILSGKVLLLLSIVFIFSYVNIYYDKLEKAEFEKSKKDNDMEYSNIEDYDNIIKSDTIEGFVGKKERIQYFEQARGTWFIKHVNLPLSAVEAEKGNVAIAPILAQTSCKYKRPVVFPDTLTVGFTSEVVNAERGDFRHSYVVYSEQQDAVVAEGTADLVAYDYKNMKREKIPDNWTFLQT